MIIETHSEVVLRQTQVLTKNMKKTDKTTSDFVKVFYTSKVKNVKSSFTKITDLGIKNNGFLSEKIKTGFFDMNTNLIKNLWKRDKTSNKS